MPLIYLYIYLSIYRDVYIFQGFLHNNTPQYCWTAVNNITRIIIIILDNTHKD
jgi:hypothetical protein